MIEFLLPHKLVPAAKAAGAAGIAGSAGAFAGAIGHSFERARPYLRQAAWLSLPISLLGLLPSIFLLQVYNRVIARGGNATLIAMVAGVLCFLCLELWLRRRRARALREAGATIDRDIPHCWRARLLRPRGLTVTVLPSRTRSTSSVAVKLRVPFGPFTSIV